MDAIKKAERRKAMGETKKVPVRIDPKQWERLDEIRKKFKFKSNYEIMQYILSCFVLPIRTMIRRLNQCRKKSK